jgi:hypothetical protein
MVSGGGAVAAGAQAARTMLATISTPKTIAVFLLLNICSSIKLEDLDLGNYETNWRNCAKTWGIRTWASPPLEIKTYMPVS